MIWAGSTTARHTDNFDSGGQRDENLPDLVNRQTQLGQRERSAGRRALVIDNIDVQLALSCSNRLTCSESCKELYKVIYPIAMARTPHN
jgi:hypothetical protein